MSNPNVAHVEKSVFSILNAENEIIGYGFFVDPHGTALTCYHIIAALTSIRIRDHDGNEHIATIDEYHTLWGVQYSDIAVLQIPMQSPTFLQLPQPKVVDQEMTVIKVNNSSFEFEDILYHNVTTPTHPPSSHGLPITYTGTTMAVGFLSVANYRNLPNLAIFRLAKKSANLELFFQYLSDKYCPGKFNPEFSELKTVCNAQLQRAFRQQLEQKFLLPYNYTPEPRYGIKLKEFIEDNNSIISLVGESGSGKTNCLLCEFPYYARFFFTIFISAHDFEPLPASLPGKIKNVLAKTLAEYPHDNITADDLMNLIYQHPKRCLIIIDGLNKMPRISSKTFDEWFTRSIRWAKGMGLKLIITSTALPTFQNSGRLDGFTCGRISKAANNYNLPTKFSKISRLNRPLLLRLLFEIGGQERSAPLDDYPLFATYLARKCTALAALINVPSQVVHSLFIEFAKHFATSNDYWLTNDTYQDILKDHPQLTSILIQENLFIESVNGVRIAHNWLADFLIGETFHPDEDIDWEQLIPISNSTQRKGLPWLLAKKSFLGQNMAVPLQNLLAFILKKDSHQSRATKIFENTVRHLSLPDQYYSIIESFTIQHQQTFGSTDITGLMVYNSHLSTSNQFKLLKKALSNEELPSSNIMLFLHPNYYEKNDYFLQLGTLIATKQILERYLLAEPDTTMPRIIDWLYDCKDQNKISVINIIAGIIIYQYDSRYNHSFNPWNKDTPAQASIIKVMITMIVASHSKTFSDVLTDYLLKDDHSEGIKNSTDFYLNVLPTAVLNVYRGLPLDQEKIKYTMLLLRVPEYRKEMISDILLIFKESKMPELLTEKLRAYVTQEGIFEVLVPMLVKYIKYGRNYRIRKDCISILFQFGKNKEQNQVLADHLAALIRINSDFELHFTRCLIRGLYTLPVSSASYQTLSATIPILLEKHLSSWYRTLKYLCREEKNIYKRADKIKWINWAFNNLPVRQQCSLVILLLNLNIIKEEDKVREMIKPTILLTLQESDLFYQAVLKKAAKKNTALHYDLLDDQDFKVMLKV